jgi:hypothetical protein
VNFGRCGVWPSKNYYFKATSLAPSESGSLLARTKKMKPRERNSVLYRFPYLRAGLAEGARAPVALQRITPDVSEGDNCRAKTAAGCSQTGLPAVRSTQIGAENGALTVFCLWSYWL